MADHSDDSTSNGVTAPQAPAQQAKTKRSRVQFSCTACRYRKLKCDRTHPCDRCTRRGDAASCTYVGHGPRTRANQVSGGNPAHVQDRIQHLENLILSFAQKRRQEDSGANDATVDPAAANSGIGSAAAMEQSTALEDDPGKIVNNEQAGTTYVDASHWQAILDDLKEVKKYVQVDGGDEGGIDDGVFNDNSTDEIAEVEHEANRPTLLFHGGRVLTKQELLADFPDRSSVDRLMGRLLNSEDPALAVIHFPTFQREYTQFWNDPTKFSLPWIGFLYGCLAMAVGMFRRSLEQLPAPLGNAVDEISRFERNCCHCLINSNYTTVGRYKVEALLIYATIEYTKRGNSAFSVSVVLGITIKLAMRMGYHRDAKHYDNISALEGEMRRRTWATICQLDTLTAFQAGIPKQTQSWQSDTELPRNIFDEDFDENSIELPPSKPDSVRTQASYLRSKSRVMAVFGQIADLAYSRQPTTYEKVLELDHKLEEAHELIASPLRMRSLNQSVTDNAGLIMKRYTLDVLYQKARIVLHRKYLVEARYNPRLGYSRFVCVNAAKEALRHQYDLFHESKVGGRLDKNNWFFGTLQNHDFVLAAMVICLELFKYNEPVITADKQQQQQPFAIAESERSNLIEILRKSREIWKANVRYSIEARKAYSALTIMLKKAAIDDEEARKRNSQSPATNSTPNIQTSSTGTPGDIAIGESASSRGLDGQDAYFKNFVPTSVNMPTPPLSNSSGQTLNNTTSTPSGITQQQQASIPSSLDPFQQQYPDFQSSLAEMDVLENMLDMPQNLDWHLWDGQMQDNDPGFMNEFWTPGAMQVDGGMGSGQMKIDNRASNGNGNNNISNNTDRRLEERPNLVSLYLAPGYRG